MQASCPQANTYSSLRTTAFRQKAFGSNLVSEFSDVSLIINAKTGHSLLNGGGHLDRGMAKYEVKYMDIWVILKTAIVMPVSFAQRVD